MKKKLSVIGLLIAIVFIFAGCGFDNFVVKTSRNVSDYSLELTLNEYSLSGTESVNYKNSSNVILNEVYFHLYPNSFTETAINPPVSSLNSNKAYPNGKSYGKIEVNNCLVNGKEASYSITGEDNHLLKIVLDNDLYPNDYVRLDMDINVVIPNILHRFGYGENTINLGNFYPIACVFDGTEWDTNPYHSNGDPFYSDIANYNVKIKYANTLTLASSGNQISTEEVDNFKLTTIQAQAVRDFAMVLSEKFEVKTGTCGDTTILYYYYSDEQSDESLNTAIKSVSTYNSTFGLYPYRTLSVVESNFVYGGMEYPNLVLISDSLNKYDDYTNTIAHEIAHQWWYGVVGNNEYKYGWLDESLTEYSVVVFYEKNPEYGVYRENCIKNAVTSYISFVDVYTDIFGELDTSMNRELNEYSTEPEYVYMAYVKGVIMFDNLREIIGDRKFFNSLKAYYNDNMGKNVTPEILIQTFENKSLRNLSGFFNSYIDGTVVIGKISNTDVTNE